MSGVVEVLGIQHRDREWVDREGKRWRWCGGGICNCWEREEAGGWLRTERSLDMASLAPFTAPTAPQSASGPLGVVGSAGSGETSGETK